jgi:hypothetical protein
LAASQFVQGVRDVNHQDLATVEQALHVLAEAENRDAVGRLVGADSFKRSGAVVQRVAQHVCRRLLPINEHAVHPDLLRGRYGHLQPLN